MRMVVRIARIRRSGRYLVNVQAVGAEVLLDAVGELKDNTAPYRRRRTRNRVRHHRRRVCLRVEVAVGTAAGSVTAVAGLVAVGGRIPQAPVDIGHHLAIARAHLSYDGGKLGFGRQIVGIMGVIGMVVPEIPVKGYALAIIVDGAVYGRDSGVAEVFGAHPQVFFHHPFGDVALGDIFSCPTPW